MSTAAVSSSSLFQELQSFYQNRQADVKQLGSALQNGDLNGAQQAYNTLAALGQSGPFGNSEPFSRSSRAQAFEAVGQALQSGDLAGAQAAFAALTGTNSSEGTSQATPSAVVSLSRAQPILALPVRAQPISAQPISATTAGSTSSIYQQLQSYLQARNADLAQLGQDLQAGNLNAAQQDFSTLTALGQSGPNKNGQPFQQAGRAQDFQAIGQALQGGDLAGAQSAFATLEGTFGEQSPQAQSAIAAYNSNFGGAEVVINLGGASSTSASSGSSVPEVVVNVGQGGSSSSGASGVSEVVINLGGVSNTSSTSASSGSSTPEVVVNVGQGSSSSSGASGVPEVVINLGGASSASSTSASSGSSVPEVVLNVGQGGSSSSASPEEVTINLGSGSSGAQVSIDATQGQNSNPADQLTINLNQQSNYELILNVLNSTATSLTQSSSSSGLSVSA
jgi:hypothetical protein